MVKKQELTRGRSSPDVLLEHPFPHTDTTLGTVKEGEEDLEGLLPGDFVDEFISEGAYLG